jgi:hypothetical protein
LTPAIADGKLFPGLKKKIRQILVILSNRWDRNKKLRHLELECDEAGTILKERALRSAPRSASYDEVWENDEGRDDFGSCYKFKRKYGHKLQKPRPEPARFLAGVERFLR